MLALRLRQSVRRGGALHLIDSAGDDPLVAVKSRVNVRPGGYVPALGRVLKALSGMTGSEIPSGLRDQVEPLTVDVTSAVIAESLLKGERSTVLLGALALHHPRYAEIHCLAQAVAEMAKASLGLVPSGANPVGAGLVGIRPGAANELQAQPHKAYTLHGIEPEMDSASGEQLLSRLRQADVVIALTAWRGRVPEYATVMLPMAPHMENEGSFVSLEGRLHSFTAAVRPQGEARPAWKILRVLGGLLDAPGFDQSNVAEVLAQALPSSDSWIQRLDNRIRPTQSQRPPHVEEAAIERCCEQGLYSVDALVRRAAALQKTADAAAPVVSLNKTLFAQIGLAEGDRVRVRQNGAEIELPAVCCPALADGCVRVPAGWAATASLGNASGGIEVEKA